MTEREEQLFDAIQTVKGSLRRIAEMAKKSGAGVSHEYLTGQADHLQQAVNHYFAGVVDECCDEGSFRDGCKGKTLEAELTFEDQV